VTARRHVETTEQFDRQFKKLDRAVQRRILSRLRQKGAIALRSL